MTIFAGWKATEREVRFRRWSELKAVLERLHRETGRQLPIGVFITRDQGNCLLVTVGAGRSPACYFPAGYDGTGSLHAVDPQVAPSSRGFEFEVFGDRSEVPVCTTIPLSRVMGLIKVFLERDGLPDTVQWDED